MLRQSRLTVMFAVESISNKTKFVLLLYLLRTIANNEKIYYTYTTF